MSAFMSKMRSLFNKAMRTINKVKFLKIKRSFTKNTVKMNNKIENHYIMVEDITQLKNSSDQLEDKFKCRTNQRNRIKKNLKNQVGNVQSLDTQNIDTDYTKTMIYKTASIKHQPKDFVTVIIVKLERFWEIHDNELYTRL